MPRSPRHTPWAWSFYIFNPRLRLDAEFFASCQSCACAVRSPVRPKFLTGSDGILLIRQEIIQSSISNYWQQGEQRIGLGLQRSRLWHLLKAWGGVFRFQPTRSRVLDWL